MKAENEESNNARVRAVSSLPVPLLLCELGFFEKTSLLLALPFLGKRGREGVGGETADFLTLVAFFALGRVFDKKSGLERSSGGPLVSFARKIEGRFWWISPPFC